MKKIYFFTFTLLSAFLGTAQMQAPASEGSGVAPDWGTTYKAPGDSCGAYFNNYIGLHKTSNLFFEALRTGGNPEYNTYGGRAQRFNAPQPIEISGIQFYAFETNPALDSIMAITILHDYTSFNDSVGVELARDTVYVKHQAFTAVLPNIEVNSFFDTPVIVTNDYMISVITPTEDSLKILVSSAANNDGAGQNLSYLIYNNPDFTPAAGYYNNFANYGLSYDLDYLISPRIKYELVDDFTILDDTICPGIVSGGCVSYSQNPIYSDIQYNSSAAAPSSNLQWLWGDGFQNTNILTACHTYNNPGDFTISLNDTLYRWFFNNTSCVGQTSKLIHVIDDVVADFTFVTGGIIVDFTSISTTADSLFWDFGDGNTGGDSITIQHNYDSLGTFDVWLYAYNECGVDSVMYQVTTDDVGFETETFDFGMYPNPANTEVSISGLAVGSRIEVINILGETIVEINVNQTKEKINLTHLSNGTYFIKLSNDSNQLTKKLIVQH